MDKSQNHTLNSIIDFPRRKQLEIGRRALEEMLKFHATSDEIRYEPSLSQAISASHRYAVAGATGAAAGTGTMSVISALTDSTPIIHPLIALTVIALSASVMLLPKPCTKFMNAFGLVGNGILGVDAPKTRPILSMLTVGKEFVALIADQTAHDLHSSAMVEHAADMRAGRSNLDFAIVAIDPKLGQLGMSLRDALKKAGRTEYEIGRTVGGLDRIFRDKMSGQIEQGIENIDRRSGELTRMIQELHTRAQALGIDDLLATYGPLIRSKFGSRLVAKANLEDGPV